MFKKIVNLIFKWVVSFPVGLVVFTTGTIVGWLCAVLVLGYKQGWKKF